METWKKLRRSVLSKSLETNAAVKHRQITLRGSRHFEKKPGVLLYTFFGGVIVNMGRQ
jgi:hypothetical protein